MLALACKSAARLGIAIFTADMPKGPIMAPQQTMISAIVVTGSLNKTDLLKNSEN